MEVMQLIVGVGPTVFTTVTPEGSSQNVDYDDEHHNETNGRSVPCGESGMSEKSLESTRKMCVTIGKSTFD